MIRLLRELNYGHTEYVVVSSSSLALQYSCLMLKAAMCPIFFSIVTALEGFWTFQFFPIIAECYTFVAIGNRTMYGHFGKKPLTDFISLFALQYLF